MVVLITGASHTGKTLLAQRMLEELGYPCLSIDHLKMGLIRSGNTDLTPEDDEALTEYLWPIIREMMKTAIENQQNLIVEGCYVPPGWREDFDEKYLEAIRFICLAMSDAYIDAHFDEIVKHASDIETRLNDSYCTPESLKADNRHYIDAFTQSEEQVTLIESDFGGTLESLIDSVGTSTPAKPGKATMRELTQDPFYELMDKDYDRCIIDYCLIASDAPYRGIRSHREAVLFAMLKMIERYIEEQHAIEKRWAKEIADNFFPWSFDFGKAEAHRIDPEEFLFVPTIVRKIKGGSVIYDRKDPDVDAGEQIPYWYAFLEPPQWFDCTPDDFRRVNDALFPEGADALEVYEWTTNWSNYFDAGREWWGTACWSVYDKRLDRFVVLFASATD